MGLPHDYAERVYAGVLGKIIGVYLGRPFEGWKYRDILAKLGEVDYYVHDKLGVPLIVTDDDISGTFTFIRALEDYAHAGKAVTAEQIGRTWLNYIIERKTILWWGGVGLSTEQTAFKRLRDGVPAPRSGSMALNSKVVAEQIGSQIFIDGWAMVAPGDPALAAELARKAASVSHDGEAIYGAQVVAAMEAMAFAEPSIDKLLDVGVSFIPKNSVIYRMISDLRAFHAREPDWQKAMTDVMERSYGYDKYGGNCHMVPNHGLIILALLYGGDDFGKSLMIANTCGWDTDCNSGNVGCLMGIKNGLAGIDAGRDWRGPVADRLYLPTADGGSCVTDAATQAFRLINIGRALAGEAAVAPKDGARFHFALPGSVQGFVASADADGAAEVANVGGRLAVRYRGLATGRAVRAATATFTPTEATKPGGYAMLASPTLSPGQTVTASLEADAGNAEAAAARLFVRYYGEKDEPAFVYGPSVTLEPGRGERVTWKVPDEPIGGQPIFEIGLEVSGERGGSGVVLLDWLTWSGSPEVTLGSITPSGHMWRKQWVDGVDTLNGAFRTDWDSQALTVIQNDGRGVAITGTRDWRDYTVSARLTPNLAQAYGLAARVQGMRRYYALLLTDGAGGRKARLVKVLHDETVLAEAPFPWQWNDNPHAFELTVRGDHIIGRIDGETLFEAKDAAQPLTGGGIALVIEEGRLCSSPVRVRPA